MKDKLQELIRQKSCFYVGCSGDCCNCPDKYAVLEDDVERIANHLLVNGVIVPPIKIGQTVYVISRYYGGFWRTHECRIDSLTIYEKHMFMTLFDSDNLDFGIEISEIGKTVFLTKEEAEKALAEKNKNN